MSEPRPPRDDAGLSLLEVVITVVILSIASALTMTALFSGLNLLGQTEDEAGGLRDLRIVTERLSRDLRAARGVDTSTSTNSELTIWIDRDANYQQSDSETITWRLQLGEDGEHYDVVRLDGTNNRATVGTSLVKGIAFEYAGPNASPDGIHAPEGAQVVQVTMTYDAIKGKFRQERKTTFDVRLRNVQ